MSQTGATLGGTIGFVISLGGLIGAAFESMIPG